MIYLRQSTPVDVELGIFVDSTDGASTEEALTLAQADLYLTKNSGTAAPKNDATSATHIWGGNYKVPLDATDTGTLGRLRLMCKKSGALPVKADFMVIPEMVYDAMYAGTDRLDVNVTHIGDTAQTPNDNGADINAILIDTDELQTNQGNWVTATGFSTHSAADVRAEMDSNSTQLAAILTDTGTTLDGKIDTIDTVVDAIKLKTDNLPDDPADESLIEAKIDALNDVSATEVKSQCDAAISDASLATAASIAALNDFDPAVDTVATVTDVTNQVTANVTAISGSSDAADNLEASAKTIVVAAATSGTLTTTAMTTTLTETTDDHYNGRIIIWTSGVLKDQATDITDYTGATKLLTYTATTEAPSDGDTFVIV